MKKGIAISIFFIAACWSNLFAQHGISMYHLKDATFQNSHFNAAYVPKEGNFFLGLPILSGINAHVSSKLSYNEIFTKPAEGDSIIVDFNKAVDNLTRQNGIYAHLNFNLLHVGYRLPNNALISFFANERVEIDFLFPKQPMQMIWEGNASLLEEDVKVGRFALSANHFREIGLGYAYEVPDFGTRFGIRLKYLQGIFNGSLPGNARADFRTENENNQINVEMENAMFRTSGLEIATGDQGDIGSHLIANGNSGFGIDLGMEYQINNAYRVALGINDLGFIRWKENITAYTFPDTTFRYTGAVLEDGVGDLQDSIDTFIDVFQYDEVEDADPYTTMLPTRIFGSVIWEGYLPFDVISTISTRIIQGQPRFSFGVGGRYTTGSGFTVSANVTKLDQQFFNIGAAIATKVSFVQFYLASDHLVGYSAPDLDAIDIRLGINFIFSKRKKSQGPQERGQYGSKGPRSSGSGRKSAKGPKYGYFLGEEVKVKGQDEIYDVIRKQKKSEPGSNQSSEPKFDKSVTQYPESQKPSFKEVDPVNATSPKPKFRKKKTIGNTSSPKPKFRKKRVVGGSSSKPNFGKKKLNNQRSKKPKFKKKKARN